MTLKEAITTIRSSDKVWLWAKVTKDEGDWFSVTKTEAIKTLKRLVGNSPDCEGHLQIDCPNGVCYIG